MVHWEHNLGQDNGQVLKVFGFANCHSSAPVAEDIEPKFACHMKKTVVVAVVSESAEGNAVAVRNVLAARQYKSSLPAPRHLAHLYALKGMGRKVGEEQDNYSQKPCAGYMSWTVYLPACGRNISLLLTAWNVDQVTYHVCSLFRHTSAPTLASACQSNRRALESAVLEVWFPEVVSAGGPRAWRKG